MEVVFPLRRITNRGNPPCIVVNREVLLRAGLSSRDLRSPSRLMLALFVVQKRSKAEIAALFGVQSETITRWLNRLGMPIRNPGDSVSMALSRYPICRFDGSPSDRAYFLGLRMGDLHAQIHGRRVRVSVGTSHPAMLHLFQSVFSEYGRVRRYPKFSRISGYHWCAYCDLDSSFEFLLKKPKMIPRDVCEDHELFLSFLAGYFDAEGCISLDGRRGHRGMCLIIKSCDYLVLKGINRRLHALGISTRLHLAAAAGTAGLKQNCWYVRACSKNDVAALLRRLPLRHPEKVAKAALALSIIRDGWGAKWFKSKEATMRLKREVMFARVAAKDALGNEHPLRRDWTTPATSRPQSSTTAL